MPPANPQEGKSPPQPPAPQNSLKQIRTYQGDVAEALSRQNESLYSIQAKEHARRGASAEAGGRSALPLLAGSLILLALTGGTGWFAYEQFVKKTAVPAPVVPQSRFFSTESEATIEVAGLGRDELIAKINAAASEGKAGETLHLDLKQGTTTESAADFLAALGAQAPGSLVRALDPVFMAGTVGERTGSAPPSLFLIFKLASYDNAFAGMLNWEKTMASDIGPLFATSDALQALGSAPVFKDVVYKNKDVRAVYAEEADPSGATTTAPVLLYSFFDNKMLIVTDRLETLETLIDRLTEESLAR